MTIIDEKGRQRVRKLAQVTKLYNNGKIEKELIHFMEPADVKGTGFLTFDYHEKDNNKWLDIQALRKTRRIISSENTKSFMDSEFTYADMTPPLVEDFTYTIAGEEEVNDFRCYKLEIIPKDDDVVDQNGYSQKISFIGKALYYDLDGGSE